MTKTAVITGAGSGVGRAIAVQLAREGWRLGLVGRRSAPLEETAAMTGLSAKDVVVVPCDIGDSSAVKAMGERIFAALGVVEVLVNAAGTNAPNRSLEVLSLEDYHTMINTNLNGAYYCVQAFLPRMRQRGSGTIINIVSDAGKQASPKAGPAYVMSKFGLAGLTQSINAEERGNGVRACAIFPGDINTPLLGKRPQPPGADLRAKMMRPEDVAGCAVFCINLPNNVIVEEMLVRPR
ncbi:MAG: Sepiapterin reductase [Verrucomicrobiales bacterium]|nr:Sepiapterin reductase [Verrucomicrobiales bacterium]